jgi:hypothetical protein
MDTVLCRAALQARPWGPQEVANTLHALAKLGHYDRAVFTLLCEHALSDAVQFNAQVSMDTL